MCDQVSQVENGWDRDKTRVFSRKPMNGSKGILSPGSYLMWFDDVRSNSILSRLCKFGIPVPPGYVTTAEAFRAFLETESLKSIISSKIKALSLNEKSLNEVTHAIWDAVSSTPLPPDFEADIIGAYKGLCSMCEEENVSVIVRVSDMYEDTSLASCASTQHAAFMNVRGLNQLIRAWKDCCASLITDHAVMYAKSSGLDESPSPIALGIEIQQLVYSERGGSSGVMFTIHTETGFPDIIQINSAWGLGSENITRDEAEASSSDEFWVYKPLLDEEGSCPIIRKRLRKKERTMILSDGFGGRTKNVSTPGFQRNRFSLEDEDILLLAKWGKTIELPNPQSGGKPQPMVIEWTKDRRSGKMYILRARPYTFTSNENPAELVSYSLIQDTKPPTLVEGISVGQKIIHGQVCVIKHLDEIEKFKRGSIIVAGTIDPDWAPFLHHAAGIITDTGGRTSHAALISREFGIPALVGTGDGTGRLNDGQVVTLCCNGSATGAVYPGKVEFRRQVIDLTTLPPTKTEIMMNLADPDSALRWWRLPIDGIGTARLEFLIAQHIQAHPMALAHPERISDPVVRGKIEQLSCLFASPADYFIQTLGRGIATLAASVYPKPAIVRMSDFKTNEYAALLGGADFELHEENPMIGFRGASRYYNPQYRDGFKLECQAVRYVREKIGLRNVTVMIPFCRTLKEADKVLEVMAEEGLVRGSDFPVFLVCEVPSNIILAHEFAKRFDYFSIGSNDLTQLTLGVDRDSQRLSHLFNERDPAVIALIHKAISDVHVAGRKVGICGQAPSDYPGFAEMLVDAGIDSVSLNPDSVLEVRQRIGTHEKLVK